MVAIHVIFIAVITLKMLPTKKYISVTNLVMHWGLWKNNINKCYLNTDLYCHHLEEISKTGVIKNN